MIVPQRRLDSIRPYPGNPRRNDSAVDAVARGLAEFGFRRPVVVDADGVIVVGHTRFKAALKLGLTEVPVHVAVGLTPAQTRACRPAETSHVLAPTRARTMTKLRKADDPLLLALACGLSAEQAAGQAGVSVRTAYRHLDDLPRDLLARAEAMLTAAAVESVRTLADLLKPANAPATRLNAARAILENGVKLRALVEVEARLKDLEDRVAQSPADALRDVVDAILYALRTGCQWRYLPWCFPPKSTVWRYFDA